MSRAVTNDSDVTATMSLAEVLNQPFVEFDSTLIDEIVERFVEVSSETSGRVEVMISAFGSSI
jgi:hypothetical protein